MKQLVLTLLLALAVTAQAWAEPITVVTEEWPPYNYSEAGVAKGVVTEVVRAALDRSGMDYAIDIYPWARSYDMAKSGENVLIYSIFKLPNREKSFKWIKIDGLSVNMHLFRPIHRGEIDVATIDQGKSYKVGVTRETSTHHFLLSKGYAEGVNLFPVNSEECNILKSNPKAKRIDMTTGDELSMARWLKVSGFPPNYWVKQAFLFKEDIYMAFGLSTSDEVVNRVRSAVQAIKEEGLLDEIIAKHHRMYQ